MLKKLSQYFVTLKKKLAAKKSPELISLPQDSVDLDEESAEEVKSYLDKLNQPLKNTDEQKEVQFHLDTGKIIFPDGMSDEDKAEVEAALQELNASLQNLAPEDLFKSLEDFISTSGTVSDERFPKFADFTKANEMDDGLAKIAEEMEFCDENCEHWNDQDFVEALIDYENKGYTFTGIDEIYRKVFEKLELSEEEQKKIRQWYKLVSQDLVYEV